MDGLQRTLGTYKQTAYKVLNIEKLEYSRDGGGAAATRPAAIKAGRMTEIFILAKIRISNRFSGF